jgi:D-glycero-D-manno-heptose 1,7-bisphosphate phosphatase
MNNWTLFLDRDGVLNKKIEGGYVTTADELVILPGVTRAIVQLSKIFGLIIVVTNQRGMAKGLYSVADLRSIHEKLLSAIRLQGGRIDGIYYCQHDKGECDCRKPGVGMALQAKIDFASIDFKNSVLVGDSPSDIQMGQTLDMITVLISDKDLENVRPHFRFSTLLQFSDYLNGLDLTNFRLLHNRAED